MQDRPEESLMISTLICIRKSYATEPPEKNNVSSQTLKATSSSHLDENLGTCILIRFFVV
jgi:hypothetical protein